MLVSFRAPNVHWSLLFGVLIECLYSIFLVTISQGNLSLSKFMWLQLIGGLYGCYHTFDCVFFHVNFCFTVKKFLCLVGCTWISISFLDSNEIFCMNSVFLIFFLWKGLAVLEFCERRAKLCWNSCEKWSVCLHQGENIGILDKMGC